MRNLRQYATVSLILIIINQCRIPKLLAFERGNTMHHSLLSTFHGFCIKTRSDMEAFMLTYPPHIYTPCYKLVFVPPPAFSQAVNTPFVPGFTVYIC